MDRGPLAINHQVQHRTFLKVAASLTNLSKASWSWECVSAVDSRGRAIFVVDAHRNGQRFVVRADEKLTAFMELESAVEPFSASSFL